MDFWIFHLHMVLFAVLFGMIPATVIVDLPTFVGDLQNITLKGDALQVRGSMVLNQADSVLMGNISCGAVITKKAVMMEKSDFFTTHFSFMSLITNSASRGGEGIGFFISPYSSAGSPPYPFGLPSLHLAVVFKSGSTSNSIDIMRDGIIPFKLAESIEYILNTGSLYSVWISFDGYDTISVFLSDNRIKPIHPTLNASSAIIKDFFQKYQNLYFGLSASTEGGFEKHIVSDWILEVNHGLPALAPESQTNNITNGSEKINLANKTGNWAIFLTAAGLFILLLMVLWATFYVSGKIKAVRASPTENSHLTGNFEMLPYTSLNLSGGPLARESEEGGERDSVPGEGDMPVPNETGGKGDIMRLSDLCKSTYV